MKFPSGSDFSEFSYGHKIIPLSIFLIVKFNTIFYLVEARVGGSGKQPAGHHSLKDVYFKPKIIKPSLAVFNFGNES